MSDEVLESVGLKTCSRCEQTLPVSEFNKCKGKKDGLQNHCRSCRREANTQWVEENREHYNELKRQYYNENYENRRKTQVYNMTRQAINRGELIRPDACPQCGANDSTVEAHHLSYDYGEELNVMWLCHKCHSALHQRNKID